MKPEKKSATIGGRLPAELRKRLDDIEKNYGVTDTTMLADALTALADYVEQQGAYRRPMQMILAGEVLPLAGEGPQRSYQGKPTAEAVAAAVALLEAKTRAASEDRASHAPHK